MMKNTWFLIGFGAARTHSPAFWGVASKVPQSMVYALLLKGPKGGLGENREGKSANRTPVEAKLGFRGENGALASLLEGFERRQGATTTKGPRLGGHHFTEARASLLPKMLI